MWRRMRREMRRRRRRRGGMSHSSCDWLDGADAAPAPPWPFLNCAAQLLMGIKKREKSPESPEHVWEKAKISRSDSKYLKEKEEAERAAEDESAKQKKEHGNDLVELILDHYLTGRKISAKSVCILCWHAHGAGVEQAERFKLSPTSQSGKFQRKLDTALGFEEMDSRLYFMETPGVGRYDEARCPQTVSTTPPHEAIASEIEKDPYILESWSSKAVGHEEEWMKAYFNHPLVKSATPEERKRILPIALYQDKAPYTKDDSFWNMTCHLVNSSHRHIVAVLKDNELCGVNTGCGCSHWCSLYPIYRMVHWSLSALFSGNFPDARHDKTDWRESDLQRKEKAGKPLGFRCVVVDIKADWPELTTGMGFPTQKSNASPCLFCKVSQKEFMEHSDHAPLTPIKQEDYEEECRKREKWVLVSNDTQFRAIKFRLEYKSRYRGRALTSDIPSLGLLKRDRLEPSANLIDTGDFDNMGGMPFKPFLVCFWRESNEERVHHRNPLLDPRLGISVLTFSIDEMHCVHLGIAKVYAGTVIWRMLLNNVFGFSNLTRKEDKIRVGLRRIKLLLDDWYPEERERRGVREDQISRIGDLTEGMIGDETNPTISTKANETKWLFRFCVKLMQQHGNKLPEKDVPVALLDCGGTLLRWMDICDAQDRHVPDDACKELNRLANLHCSLCVQAMVHILPKHHLFKHLSHGIAEKGAPKFYHTYLDEHTNGVIAKICATCHRNRFERRVFSKYGYMHGGREGWA
eukprot:9469938-Pyramimonas_sp.AAC.1